MKSTCPILLTFVALDLDEITAPRVREWLLIRVAELEWINGKERQRDVAAGSTTWSAERAKHHSDDRARHKEKPTGRWSGPCGAVVVRAPPTGLDNKEPPGQ